MSTTKMSQEEILNTHLKGLDTKYNKTISYLEQRQQELLQKAINTINNHASECRRKIETEYRNERDKIKQKLFQLQMQSHINTHQPLRMQNNEIIPQNSITGRRLNRRDSDIKIEIIDNIDEQNDSDVIIIEPPKPRPPPPPRKKHKSNLYNQNTNSKKKSRFEESDSDTDNETESHSDNQLSYSEKFDSHVSSKRHKKLSRKRHHKKKRKRKQKRMVDSEYEHEDEDMYTDSDTTRNNNNKPKKKSKSENSNELTVYYKKKQEGVIKARKRFNKLPRNEKGKIVIKLPIETVCSEYKAKRIYVTDFGKIPKNPTKAEKYCDGSYIYPIGYKAYRIHLSYKNPPKNTKYFMHIKDNGMEGPMYEVYAEDDKEKKMTHSAATKPWEDIIDKISKEAEKRNIENKKDGNRSTHGTSGPRYLGLRDYMIMGIVELLPNAKNCTKYWTAKKPKYNIPPKPFFTDITTNDIIIQ